MTRENAPEAAATAPSGAIVSPLLPACFHMWQRDAKFDLLLLYCELHFLYAAFIDIGEDEGVAQCLALFH